jgi:hypothetical protein
LRTLRAGVAGFLFFFRRLYAGFVSARNLSVPYVEISAFQIFGYFDLLKFNSQL